MIYCTLQHSAASESNVSIVMNGKSVGSTIASRNKTDIGLQGPLGSRALGSFCLEDSCLISPGAFGPSVGP